MNERNLNRFYLFRTFVFGIILCFSLSGCHSQRNAVKSGLEGSVKAWERLSMPVRISLDSPAQFSLSGQAILQRDSMILLSFRMLGFEVAAVQIDQDSALIVDKYHKYFIKTPTSGLARDLGISPSDIQDLLLGRVPTFKIPKGVEDWTIDVVEDQDIIRSISIHTPSYAPLTIEYGDQFNTRYGTIAGSVRAKGALADKTIELQIRWNPASAKWNDEVALRKISIGKGYKEISAENLKNMFSGIGGF